MITIQFTYISLIHSPSESTLTEIHEQEEEEELEKRYPNPELSLTSSLFSLSLSFLLSGITLEEDDTLATDSSRLLYLLLEDSDLFT